MCRKHEIVFALIPMGKKDSNPPPPPPKKKKKKISREGMGKRKREKERERGRERGRKGGREGDGLINNVKFYSTMKD